MQSKITCTTASDGIIPHATSDSYRPASFERIAWLPHNRIRWVDTSRLYSERMRTTANNKKGASWCIVWLLYIRIQRVTHSYTMLNVFKIIQMHANKTIKPLIASHSEHPRNRVRQHVDSIHFHTALTREPNLWLGLRILDDVTHELEQFSRIQACLGDGVLQTEMKGMSTWLNMTENNDRLLHPLAGVEHKTTHIYIYIRT